MRALNLPKQASTLTSAPPRSPAFSAFNLTKQIGMLERRNGQPFLRSRYSPSRSGAPGPQSAGTASVPANGTRSLERQAE